MDSCLKLSFQFVSSILLNISSLYIPPEMKKFAPGPCFFLFLFLFVCFLFNVEGETTSILQDTGKKKNKQTQRRFSIQNPVLFSRLTALKAHGVQQLDNALFLKHLWRYCQLLCNHTAEQQ